MKRSVNNGNTIRSETRNYYRANKFTTLPPARHSPPATWPASRKACSKKLALAFVERCHRSSCSLSRPGQEKVHESNGLVSKQETPDKIRHGFALVSLQSHPKKGVKTGDTHVMQGRPPRLHQLCEAPASLHATKRRSIHQTQE